MAINNFKYAQLQPFALAGGGAIAGATTLFLQSMTDIDGNALSMSGTFGTKGFGTLDPGNGTLEEQISFTGLTNNTNGTVTLNGVSSVTFVYPYTETSGLAKTHAGATPFVISNTAGFYNKVVSKDDDATVTAKITFPNDDISNAGIATDTDTAVATAFVTFGQLSRQAISGASNAAPTVKGIVQLPTQAQVDAKTTAGSTGALLALTPDKQRSTLLSDYVADTGAADAYVITPVPAIAAYTTGQIFSFKSTHTNTTTSTLNVSGLGVKTIKKLDGATNLAAGDIVLGQIITVEYDGTNFQMLNPVGNAPTTSTQLTAALKFGGDGTDGALTVTSGTTTIDCGAAAYFEKNYSSISITGTGAIQFINPHANGTVIVLRCQGNAVLTSSTAPMIDASGMGAAGGAAGASGTTTASPPNLAADALAGVNGTSSLSGGSGAGGGTFTLKPFYTTSTNLLYRRSLIFTPGGGGGGGANGSAASGVAGVGGAGGRGGGGLLFEIRGSINFTTALGISVAGKVGSNGTAGTGSSTQIGTGGGGGGGGSGGWCIVLYNTSVAVTGTINTNGGGGGNGGNSYVGTNSNVAAGGGGGGSGEYNGSGGAGGNAGNPGASGSAGANSASTGTGGAGGGGGTTGAAFSAAGGGGGGGSAGEQIFTSNKFFA